MQPVANGGGYFGLHVAPGYAGSRVCGGMGLLTLHVRLLWPPSSSTLHCSCVSTNAAVSPLSFFLPSSLLLHRHTRPSYFVSFRSHVWECLMHTLVRVGQRIAQITPKLEAVKDQAGVRHRKVWPFGVQIA